jgi:hypothetical protein
MKVSFIRTPGVLAPAAALAAWSGAAAAQDVACGEPPEVAQHHHIPASADTVHFGYSARARRRARSCIRAIW